MENEQEIKELVIARLETLPAGKEISIGGSEAITKDELIQHIKDGDNIGKKMIEVEINFLRGLKEGLFYAPGAINNEA